MLFSIPFYLFCILLFLGRDDLGLKGIVSLIVGWLALPYAFSLFGIAPALLVSAQALICVPLVLIVFKGDVKFSELPRNATLRSKLRGRRDDKKPDDFDPYQA